MRVLAQAAGAYSPPRRQGVGVMSWAEYLAVNWWQLALMGGLLLASGFFSGTETALFNLTRGQLYRLAHSPSKVARLTASVMSRPRRVLQTLLLGNMIVNVGYSATAAVVVLALSRRGLAGWAVAAAALLGVLVLILLGEVTPKMLAYRLRQRWATLAIVPVVLVIRGFSPVVWALEKAMIAPLTRLIAPGHTVSQDITNQELSAMLDLSAERGLIDRDANALLREIVQLTHIRVADVMVPRVDVIAYDVDAPPSGLVELFRRTRLRKLPVYEGDIDGVLGLVHAKRLLLAPEAPLRQLVVKAPFIPAAGNVERALLQLCTTGRQMAIVVDEYGGVAGLVTLEDIIEEIVGNIDETREDRAAEPVRRTGENEYILDGDLAIHEWLDAFKIDLSGQRISTIGGFVVSLLGHIPTVGETASYRNLHFTVEAMRGRRISKLRLQLLEAGE